MPAKLATPQKEWVRFDLAALVTGTAEQMCLLAEDKGIVITTDARRRVPVDGDRARVKQVVVNLLDNAIKYTPTEGAVRLSVTAADKQGRAGSGGQRHRHPRVGPAAYF